MRHGEGNKRGPEEQQPVKSRDPEKQATTEVSINPGPEHRRCRQGGVKPGDKPAAGFGE